MNCPCNSVPCVCPRTTVPRGPHGTKALCQVPPAPIQSHCFGCFAPYAVGPLPTTGLASAESPPTDVMFCEHGKHKMASCSRCSTPAAAPLRPAREQALEDALREIRRRIELSPPAAPDWSVHRTTILDVDDIAFRALHGESGNGHVLPPSPAPQAGAQKDELEVDHAAGDELALGGDVDDVHANPIDGYLPTRKRKSSYSVAAAPLRPAREVEELTRAIAALCGGHESNDWWRNPVVVRRVDRLRSAITAILADRAARPEVAEVERLRVAMALLREWTNDQTAAGRMDCYGDCRNECLDDDGNFITDRTKACWKHRRFWLLAADRRGEP